MDDYVNCAELAARAGAAVLQSWIGRFRAREKGPADLVTEADLASQEAIRKAIAEQFPTHGILGEEEGLDVVGADAEFRWIVDPLDGTLNYVHGMPGYAVSIALERAGRIVAGAVYDPWLDECFTAAAGQGARLNGKPLCTSGVTRLREALVAVSFPTAVTRTSPEVQDFLDILENCQATRRGGSAALNLSYVAAGRLDAYWALSNKAWDVAAGGLIVTEAGGLFTDPDGGPIDLKRPRHIAAATAELHADLRGVIGRGR